jgi:hypothetical protein
MIYYSGIRPHSSHLTTRVNIFNEVIIMFMNYHLICFSNFNLDLLARFQMGYSQISLIGLLIVVNLSIMIAL